VQWSFLSFYLLPAKQSISEEPTAKMRRNLRRMRSSKEEEGLHSTLF
jgi:hypothetical protein